LIPARGVCNGYVRLPAKGWGRVERAWWSLSEGLAEPVDPTDTAEAYSAAPPWIQGSGFKVSPHGPSADYSPPE